MKTSISVVISVSVGFALVGLATGFRPAPGVTTKPPEWWTNATARATRDAAERFSASAAFPSSGVVVPVRWILVVPGARAVTRARINAQLGVLNQKFAPINVRFTTHSVITRRYNKRCTDDFYPDVARFVNPLPAAPVYNIVVCAMPNNLGVATLSTEDDVESNSMVIHPRTFPKGRDKTYGLGYTAVHELGHTFGLEHVFGETCARDADGIRDTPIQSTPTTGCPRRKDSCPYKRGLDSVRNFMDYSDDACMRGFTRGQHARMRMWIANYKTSFFSKGPGKPPFALDAYSFTLKIVGRARCPGYLTAGGCDYPFVYPVLDDDFSYWYTSGGWSSPVTLSNYGADAGCEEVSFNEDGYVVLGSDPASWVFEWLGNDMVRVKIAGSSYYLGMAKTCDDAFAGVYANDGSGLTTWKIE